MSAGAEVERGPLVSVMGPCRVLATGEDVERSPLTIAQARLVARLAAAPTAVDLSVLAEAVWGSTPPRTARAALANQISRVRAVHGDRLVLTSAQGYRLGVPTDVQVVADHVGLAEDALADGDPELALHHADTALQWCRGRPFGDLDHVVAVGPARRHAEELQLGGETLRLAAAIEVGRVGWAVAEGERLVAATPYDERRWELLAQALEGAGRRGDALASLDRARRVLRAELGLDLGQRLRGFEAALRAGGDGPRPARLVQCVGRETLIDDLVAAATESRGVLLRTEEGGGGTTVLRELARRLRGAGHTVGFVACADAPARPLAELVELLDQLVGVAPASISSAADVFVASVGALALERPVTLLVDDLHHAGPSTVAALARAAELPRVALVATSRVPVGETAEGGTLEEVVLPPLDAVAVATLVSRALGRRLGAQDPVVRRFGELAGGNPLYLSALLDLPDPLAITDELVGGPDRTAPHGGTGAHLAALVRARVDRLGEPARAALELAAVAGPQLPESLARALLTPDGLESAVSSGVLDLDGETLRFRHGAVQLVLYQDVAPGRRIELHQLVGRELLASRGALAGARHLLVAAELDPPGAVEALASAALESGRSGAHLDAAQWYDRATQAASWLGPDGDSRRLQLRISHGDSLRLAGHPRQGEVLLGAFDEAVRSGDPAQVADAATAVLALGVTTEAGRPHEQVQRVAAHALTVVTDTEDRARVQAAASLAYSMAGEVEQSRDLFERAELAATSDHGRRQVLPYAYMALGLPGDLERRDALGRELLGLAVRGGDPVAEFEARHVLFSAALQRADGAALRGHLVRMQELIPTVGDVGRRWSALYAMAAVAHLDDDLAASEQLSGEALAARSSSRCATAAIA